MAAGLDHDRKTPGVYVTELSAFTQSVVGVDTAVPIFIGYTETAKDGAVRPIATRLRLARWCLNEPPSCGKRLPLGQCGRAGLLERVTIDEVALGGEMVVQ